MSGICSGKHDGSSRPASIAGETVLVCHHCLGYVKGDRGGDQKKESKSPMNPSMLEVPREVPIYDLICSNSC